MHMDRDTKLMHRHGETLAHETRAHGDASASNRKDKDAVHREPCFLQTHGEGEQQGPGFGGGSELYDAGPDALDFSAPPRYHLLARQSSFCVNIDGCLCVYMHVCVHT